MENGELLLQHLRRAVKGVARVASDDQVRGQDWLLGREAPHVEVMDLGHEGQLKQKGTWVSNL